MNAPVELRPELQERLVAEAKERGDDPQQFLDAILIRELDRITRQRSDRKRLRHDLRSQAVPQSLAELRPRVATPPGVSPIDMIVGHWPGDETLEELLTALAEVEAEPTAREPR